MNNRPWRYVRYCSHRLRRYIRGCRKTSGCPQQPVSEVSYFDTANTWSDDVIVNLMADRQVYRWMIIGLILVCCLLLIIIIVMLPLHQLQPLMIHHFEDGRISVDAPTDSLATLRQSSLQHDLVQYVIDRESFDPIAYVDEYRAVLMASNAKTADDFVKQQGPANPSALVHVMGDRMYRTIHVDDVIILDQRTPSHHNDHQHHRNLAEIHYTAADHVVASGTVTTHPYTLLVSWEYHAPSLDPEVRWHNWDGFLVVHYQRHQSIIHSKEAS